MKKIAKIVIVLLIQIMLVATLVGCSAGSKINTVLTVNKDMSGERIIQIDIVQSVFDEYFTGTIENLLTLVENKCPKEMEWDFAEENGTKSFSFNIKFNNVDEYKEKIKNILGNEKEIKISSPDSVWVNGIFVDEDFKSSDLVQWLSLGLVEDGYVSSSNVDMIFSDGETNVIYNDLSISSSSTIYVDKIDYIDIEGIHFLTEIKGIDNYTRTTVFEIPKASIDKKETEIAAFFESVLPEGATKSVETTDFGVRYIITKENVTLEALRNYNISIFGKENVLVEEHDISESLNPFAFGSALQENIMFTNYMVDGGTGTHSQYLIKVDEGMEYFGEFNNYYKNYAYYDSDEFPGYMVVFDNYYNGNKLSFPFVAIKEYKVAAMEVNTNKSMVGNKWTKETEFILDKTPTEDETAEIIARFEERAGIWNDAEETQEVIEAKLEKAEVNIASDENKEGKLLIQIKQKGTSKSIEESNLQLFGDKGEITYACDTKFFKVKKQEAFREYLDYSKVLNQTDVNFIITYSANFGMLQKMEYSNLPQEENLIKGGKLVAIMESPKLNVTYAGTTIDIIAILFWISVGAGVVSLFLLLLKTNVLKGIIKIVQINRNKKAQKITQLGMTEENKKNTKMYCEACGNFIIEEDALFCQNCGHKNESQISTNKEINNMFCKYCGKQLSVNELCECAGSITARQTAEVKTTEAEKNESTSNSQDTVNPIITGDNVEKVKETWAEFMGIIVAPVTNGNIFLDKKDRLNSMIFILFQAILSSIFVVCIISKINHLMGIGGVLLKEYKFSNSKAFFVTLLLSLLMSSVFILLFMVSLKLIKKQVTFDDAIAAAALKSTSATPVIALSIILVLLNPAFGIGVFCLASLLSMVSLIVVFSNRTDYSKNKLIYLFFVFIILFVVIEVFIISKSYGLYLPSALKDIMSGGIPGIMGNLF